MIGHEYIAGIIFDVVRALDFHLPKWIQPNDRIPPEICDVVGHLFVPVEGLDDCNGQEDEGRIECDERPHENGKHGIDRSVNGSDHDCSMNRIT